MINAIKRKLGNFVKRKLGILDLEWKISTQEKKIEFLTNLVNVGADVDHYGKGWGVICLRGKTEYVSFFNLDSRDMKEIQDYLRYLQSMGVDKKNIIIDSPHGMNGNFFL